MANELISASEVAKILTRYVMRGATEKRRMDRLLAVSKTIAAFNGFPDKKAK